eukprot:Cvel_14154.t1-p1 / transcript=Cvel_14154.t1 / gene=Cvel_14154 / organism=Chromera_velia_CCMP2878 / gene_product=cAMP-dependent protein kinase catalytic subunit, putative / transcript_product=cAMP-dependent protein kinase catalytic subunit, putative / location=Cvel_scaffold997:20681-24643(+) / protein_length=402 / sequence_SO=supercontig / SO=protein_coding / is_pseudo=false
MFEASPFLTGVSYADFEFLRVVGRGAYSTVHLVQHKTTGCHYAIKEIAFNRIQTHKQGEHVQNEKKILQELSEDDEAQKLGVLKLRETFKDRVSAFLVLDFCSGAPLHSHFRREKGFEETRAAFYGYELAGQLKRLHELGWLYRDMKAANVLLSGGRPRLVDFGFAKKIGSGGRTMSVCGTFHAMAPEMHRLRLADEARQAAEIAKVCMQVKGEGGAKEKGTEGDSGAAGGDGSSGEPEGYSFEVDWWGLGVLLFEMIACRPPFGYGESESAEEDGGGGGEGDDGVDGMASRVFGSPETLSESLPPGLSSDCVDCICGLLQADPSKRLGTRGPEDVLGHPFFRRAARAFEEKGEVPPFNAELGHFLEGYKDGGRTRGTSGSLSGSEKDEVNETGEEDPFEDF